MLELRDYANEGGKLIVDGRNVHQAFTSHGTSLTATGPYTWTPDKLFGFYYPDNNGGDDDLPGTAFQRSRSTSNDTWQNYLGVVGRQGGIGVATAHANNADGIAGCAGRRPRPAACSTAWRRSRSTTASATTRTRTPTARRCRSRSSRCACATGRAGHQRAAAPGAHRGRLRHHPGAVRHDGGAIISTRDSVTFGFGLEQVDATTRNELLKRSLELPAADHGRHHAADDRRLQVPGRTPRRPRPTRSRPT